MKQTIAVVGASTFLGRRIVAHLQSSDWVTPIAIDYDIAGLPSSVRSIRVSNSESWTHAIQDCNAVVNASFGSASTITSMMTALIEAAQSTHSKPRIVNVSSMTVYGAATGLVDEDQAPVGSLNDYASARLEAERIAQGYPRIVTLRPGCEYGPGCYAWSERIARLLLARRIGDLGARGDGYCNLIFIDDLVRAVGVALTQPGLEGQAFNIAMCDPPTWNEYFIQFGQQLGAVPVRRVTQRRMKIETKLLAIPLKVGEIALGKIGLASALPPAIPPSLLDVCRQEIRLDVSRAEARLGLRWTPLDEGLRQTAAALGRTAAALAESY